MTRSPRVYIALTGLLGGTVAATAHLWMPSSVPIPATFVVLAVLAAVSSQVPVRFVRDGAIQGFTLEGGVLVALLLNGAMGLAPLVLVTTSVFAHAVRSRDLRKTVFNAGRTGLETTAGTAVFWLLAPSDLTTGVGLLAAVAVAAVTYEVVSSIAMTELVHRLTGRPRREAAAEVSDVSMLTFGANTMFGVILGTVAQVSLVVTLVAGLMMVGLYLGFRGYAAAVLDRQRAHALSDLTHLLLDLPSSDEVPTFLTEVVAAFGGSAGELIVPSGDEFRHYVYGPDGVTDTGLTELPRAGLLATAIARGGGILEPGHSDSGDLVDALAAPIEHRGTVLGALAVFGRNGLETWGPADAALLSAVATELAVAIQNIGLLQRVTQERGRLAARTRELSEILTAASDGIASLDAGGIVRAWNPGMASLTGLDSDLALGQHWSSVLRLRRTTGEELAAVGDHVITRGLTGESTEEAVALQVMRNDGQWRQVTMTASSVREFGDTPRGLVLIGRDVTAQREVEDLKADVIATVSHELRTPLTPLKGFLAVLDERGSSFTPEELQTVHGRMASQVARLETLLADLLAVAELDHGSFALTAEPVDLGQLVRDIVEMEAVDEPGRFTVHADAHVMAVADSRALGRIVRALVSNTRKHAPGPVEVVVAGDGEWATVAVTDQGPGIPAWELQRVFDRFSRLGPALQRPQGPGLGLTIAKALAERLGGGIDVVSEPDAGSTFTVRIPRARPRPVSIPDARHA